jgi:Holliday junction DNA helicase RuvA
LKDWSSSEGNTQAAQQKLEIPNNQIYLDAESALIALGYKPIEAAKVLSSVLKDNEITRSEDLIRLALRTMMPKA